MPGQIMMLFWIFALCILEHTTSQRGNLSVSILQTNGSPIILQCQTVIPENAININHRWKFNETALTKNSKVLVTPSRYSVRYQNGSENMYTLTIQNPIKADEGVYQCRMKYTVGRETFPHSENVGVKIDSYLPASRYPLCSIKPSETLSNGSFAEFGCKVGRTTAQITLNLALQSQNGSIIHLGNDIVRRSLRLEKPVTLQNNNSMFICEMTSETFPTAYRTCSAGPLTIYIDDQFTMQMSTQSSKPPTSGSTAQLSEARTKMNNSNNIRRKVFILNLVWCASGAFILSFLIVISAVLCQGRTSKNACTATPSLKSVRKISNASENTFSLESRRYRSRYATSRNQPSTVGYPASHDDRPNQIPLYAIVHQTNSDESSLDTKAANISGVEEYEDIDPSEQNELSESFKEDTPKSKANTQGAQANQTTIPDEYEDVQLPAKEELEEFSVNSNRNTPISEAMHCNNSNVATGQLPSYAIVHQSNSSDEDVSNISAKDTAEYEDVDFPSKPYHLSSSSPVNNANKKLRIKSPNSGGNASDSSELVDNIIYVSSGP